MRWPLLPSRRSANADPTPPASVPEPPRNSIPSSPASESLLPPELVDRIIDHLHAHVSALKACSLVCHSWRPASQFHLLAAVRIDGVRRGSWAAARLRFLDDMASARARTHIRSLTLRARTRAAPRDVGFFFAPWASLQDALPAVAVLTTRTLNAAPARYGPGQFGLYVQTPPLEGVGDCAVRSVTVDVDALYHSERLQTGDAARPTPGACAYFELAIHRAEGGLEGDVNLALHDHLRGALSPPNRFEIMRLPYPRATDADNYRVTLDRTHPVVRAMRMGDSLHVHPRAVGAGWVNHVYSVEVTIVTSVK